MFVFWFKWKLQNLLSKLTDLYHLIKEFKQKICCIKKSVNFTDKMVTKRVFLKIIKMQNEHNLRLIFMQNIYFALYFFRRITFLWQIGPIAISVDVSNQFRFRRKSLLRRLRRNCWWPRICGLFKSIKGFRTESVRFLDKLLGLI